MYDDGEWDKFCRTVLQSGGSADGERGTFVLKTEAAAECAAEIGDLFLCGAGRYDAVRGWLCDEESRRLFDLEILQKALQQCGVPAWLTTYAVNTGISTEDYAKLLKEVKKTPKLKEFVRMGSYAKASLVDTYLLDQYEYKDVCTLDAGEVFFDCGGYCGDTAVWAMEKIGEGGAVVSFEPLEDLAVMAERNIATYAAKYKARSNVLRYAVSNENGVAYFCMDDASSKIGEEGEVKVQTIRIDDYCKEGGAVPTFIKMDIEGAELSALEGAAHTIKAHKPKLAICVYHKPAEDMWEIPRYIKSLVPDYRLYMKKSSTYHETVLFAVSKG